MKFKKYIDAIRKLYCKHPFEKSELVHKIQIPEKMFVNIPYTVNIRHCKFCDKYFIDEGYEP